MNKSEGEIAMIISYIIEIQPSMKQQFANMSNEKRNEVVKNINFEVFE